MFLGSIPQPMRQALLEHVRAWSCEQVYVGCSGNLTIERVLSSLPRTNGGLELHGCDVSLYSCALGSYYAGTPLELRLNPDYEAEYGWLAEYLEQPAAALATLLLASNLLAAGVGRRNAYYDRMRRAVREQWPRLHAETRAKVEALDLELASFACQDVVQWIDDVPPEAGVIAYPPFWAGGYEAMFAKLERLFAWQPPEYELLDASEFYEALFDKFREHEHWLYGAPEQLEGRGRLLRGFSQTTSRTHPIYLYGSKGPARVVRPRQEIAQASFPRLGSEEEIGDELAVVPLPEPEFNALRSACLNPHIAPASCSGYGVLVDGKLVGAFAVRTGASAMTELGYVYLMSDFAIRPSRYKRLSKLVLYAALSHEARIWLQRTENARLRVMTTTAWTNAQVSMKYRGLFTLEARKPAGADKKEKWMLNYSSPVGRWSLAEGLAEWKRKFA